MKRIGLLAILILYSTQVFSQNFSAAVSPPRFELPVQAGKKVKQSFTLFNVANQGSEYHISTNDWQYNHGNLRFQQHLKPDSCRPWVKLERHKISVPAGSERKFRFEVDVPADAKTRECRFAIMVESTEPASNNIASSINMPVNGRLAVIVYLSINGAEPNLQINTMRVVNYQGMQLPALNVSNTGLAHGRLKGTLAASSVDGKALDFSVSTAPVMSGGKELLVLMPSQRGKALKKQSWKYPISLKGKLYWKKGAFSIDKQLAK